MTEKPRGKQESEKKSLDDNRSDDGTRAVHHALPQPGPGHDRQVVSLPLFRAGHFSKSGDLTDLTARELLIFTDPDTFQLLLAPLPVTFSKLSKSRSLGASLKHKVMAAGVNMLLVFQQGNLSDAGKAKSRFIRLSQAGASEHHTWQQPGRDFPGRHQARKERSSVSCCAMRRDL